MDPRIRPTRIRIPEGSPSYGDLSEPTTPRSRRRWRLGRALQGTAELAQDMVRDMRGHTSEAERAERRDHGIISSNNRRRRRSPSAQEPSSDLASEDAARRSPWPKRRRLDHDGFPNPRKSIKYGHFGQVEPGSLQLELVSCDGGEHVDPQSPGMYLGARNLLRHDMSVYCSERRSSVVIIRHADDTPFCLEKLHIVGPSFGFTAPVREGLVYVAMTLNDLEKYLDPPPYARREGIHSPPYHSRRRERVSRRPSRERLTLSDALRDPEVNAALDARRHDLAGPEENYYGEDFGFGRADPEAHCELPNLASVPYALLDAEGDRLPVTTLSDDDAGPEEPTSREFLEFRLQRLRLAQNRWDVGYDRAARRQEMQGLHFDANDRDRYYSGPSRSDPPMPRFHVREPQAPDGLPEHPHPLERQIKGAELDAQRDPNVTCTRFHIRRGKHKVALGFEPGLSGRYIMLKFWAYSTSTNVDVQSVIAKGYGGCRFFPAREPL